jgi:hypothetical protein
MVDVPARLGHLARRQLEGRFYDEPHRFTPAMQDDAFTWLDRHLKV